MWKFPPQAWESANPSAGADEEETKSVKAEDLTLFTSEKLAGTRQSRYPTTTIIPAPSTNSPSAIVTPKCERLQGLLALFTGEWPVDEIRRSVPTKSDPSQALLTLASVLGVQFR